MRSDDAYFFKAQSIVFQLKVKKRGTYFAVNARRARWRARSFRPVALDALESLGNTDWIARKG